MLQKHYMHRVAREAESLGAFADGTCVFSAPILSASLLGFGGLEFDRPTSQSWELAWAAPFFSTFRARVSLRSSHQLDLALDQGACAGGVHLQEGNMDSDAPFVRPVQRPARRPERRAACLQMFCRAHPNIR